MSFQITEQTSCLQNYFTVLASKKNEKGLVGESGWDGYFFKIQKLKVTISTISILDQREVIRRSSICEHGKQDASCKECMNVSINQREDAALSLVFMLLHHQQTQLCIDGTIIFFFYVTIFQNLKSIRDMQGYWQSCSHFCIDCIYHIIFFDSLIPENK